ncbi:hypothetical protein TNCV_2542461 [Trichonephila clavipes]|nr:hypothetical protein TNCV_2542461 [Trichonephila clavipes]
MVLKSKANDRRSSSPLPPYVTQLRLRAKTACFSREQLDPTTGQPDCTLSAAVLPWTPEENLKHTKRRYRQGLYNKYTKI